MSMISLLDFTGEAFGPLVQVALISSLVFGLILSGYRYYETNYTYWTKRGIKSERFFPLIGELWKLKNKLKAETRNVKKYGKVYGSFTNGKPRLMVADPEIIRKMSISDFDAFPNHQIISFANKYQKFFLVWLTGSHWKKVRSMMTPTFTSNKIKKMYRFLDRCADDLVAVFKEKLDESSNKESGIIVNLRDAFGLYTMDGITTCCYGLKLEREKDDGGKVEKLATRNSFVRHALKIFGYSSMRVLLILSVPTFILKLINFKLNPESGYKPLVKILEQLIKKREKNDSKKCDDLLQLLVDAKVGDQLDLMDLDGEENHHAGLTHESLRENQAKMVADVRSAHKNDVCSREINSSRVGLSERMSHTELLSEAVFLLAAGMETTRTLLTSCGYSLAFHPEIQERLYEELMKIVEYETTTDEKQRYMFSYEKLTSCHYLDAVISETLRILAPAPQTDRTAIRDYYIEKYGIHVPKGSQVIFCIYAVQNDPDYWDEPEKFNPERFMPENKDKIVPGSYCPFGLGPRHCVGMRFSLTEAKLGLAKVLVRYRFEPAPGTEFPPTPTPLPGMTFIKSPLARCVPRANHKIN